MLPSLWKLTGLFPSSLQLPFWSVTLKEHTLGWGLCCAWDPQLVQPRTCCPGQESVLTSQFVIPRSEPIAQAVAK